MDVEKPAMYWMDRKFTTPKGTYTNLVYRIHREITGKVSSFTGLNQV
ncbi:MAG: hypothetical protein GY846_13225 [Deltaproteobacteria bacterium]|nr:hypothetical protein [Deltaproteobacteria bacterium]